MSGTTGRKVARRACDGCKIRKIKCSEVSPCDGCVAAGVACTFVKAPHTRGPRRLRKTTLDEIKQTQRQWADSGLVPTTVAPPVDTNALTEEMVFAPSKVAALVLQLCIYRLRMYPVWPIIKVERLVASLQSPERDIEVFALAYAVAAATIAQIKSKPSSQPGAVTAEMMEAQCLYAKATRRPTDAPNVTTVRIALFLHYFYEAKLPGGLQSILHLREAIAIAHVMGLHRESYYVNVPVEEQQIRRRTLWLLFLTERGVSILHKVPATLKTKIEFPNTNDTDESDVLCSFQKLVRMFYAFDQSGIFELLDNADFDTSKTSKGQITSGDGMATIQRELSESLVLTDLTNDVQAVDIALTHSWMRVILWRLSESHGIFARPSEDHDLSQYGPIRIAKEFLDSIARVPDTAIEAHGPSLELKVFEIASSVIDALLLGKSATSSPHYQGDLTTSRGILPRLQRLFARNEKLSKMFREKTTTMQQRLNFSSELSLQPTPEGAQRLSHIMDWDIDKELEDHGFHFSEPLADESPSAASYGSENSPLPVQPQGNVRHLSSPSVGQTRDWAQQESLAQNFSAQFPNPDDPLHWSMNQQPIPSTGFENTYKFYGQNDDLRYDGFNVDPSLDSFVLSTTGWSDNSVGHNSSQPEEVPSIPSAKSWHQ